LGGELEIRILLVSVLGVYSQYFEIPWEREYRCG
jgi:hypothetical protein